MKPSYDPKLNAEAGVKGSIDAVIASGSAVAAAAIAKNVMNDQTPEVENAIAGLISLVVGGLVGYLKRRYTNWKKNR